MKKLIEFVKENVKLKTGINIETRNRNNSMKKKILILGGGISRERLISLETAKSVFKELKKKNYTVLICEPDGNLLKKIKSFKPNIIFNALHGQFGEDGYIQAILESQKVKYTHSGVMASFIAMNKEISKKLYIKNKIYHSKVH